jgi:integrative and conjugative element protein (TIGR02256 family)
MGNLKFIELAHEYTNQSHHISHVTDIQVDEANKKASFTATFKLNFPSAITGDETEFGVRREEKVKFEFCEKFPSKAPFITLRKDFPRDFEHINPNSEVVNPCIYDANLNELLQQPCFFDGILDQMAFWLDKTVTNSLFDESQGWEPMRSDNSEGEIEFPISFVEKQLVDGINTSIVTYWILDNKNTFFYVRKEKQSQNVNKDNISYLIPFMSESVADRYYPNNINTYRDLVDFCKKVHISNLDEYLSKNYKLLEKVSYVFITLFVLRPAKVIGTNLDYEIMNFAINVKTLEKTKNGKKIQHGTKVYTLSSKESPSKELLGKFSGLNKKQTNKDMTITQIGCGSLGSKIILHLARTGITDNINLVDKGFFSAHNYARHGLSNANFIYGKKSLLLSNSLNEMGLKNIKYSDKDVKDLEESLHEDQILIDSTADISVRNFLINDNIKSEVIYTVLHQLATFGLVFIEGRDRSVRIDDLMVEFYFHCYYNDELSKLIRTNNVKYEAIGQGCGSLTTIVSDATISLQAASMANIIQNRLEHGSKDFGELYIGQIQNNINISWQNLDVLPPVILNESTYNMQVRVSARVINMIKEESKKHLQNETGGVLIGHISLINRTFTIVDFIDAPEDSKRNTGYFELGTIGLKDKIESYEIKTNGLLTYIGTWHTHPNGGGPSGTDKRMKEKLMKDRENCPSVCLIYSGGNFLTF